MDSLDDDIEKLLALERQRRDIAPERVRAIVDAATQKIALEPLVAPPDVTAAPSLGVSAAQAAVWSVAVFVAGLGTGVALTHWLMSDEGGSAPDSADAGIPVLLPPQREASGSDPTPPTDDATQVPIEVGDSGGQPPSGERTSRARAEVDADQAPTRDSALETERLLVEAAQSALARGEAASALEHAAEHERSFPSGRLAAQREALAIRALLRLGRVEEAHQRAQRFDVRYPGSLLRGSFASALDRGVSPEARD